MIKQMCAFLFALSVICSVNLAASKSIYVFPPEKAEMILENAIKCITESGLQTFVGQEIKQGKYTDDERTLGALVCANEKIGYSNESGRLNIDKIMIDLFPLKPEIRSDLEACNKDYGLDPVGTFKSFLICFRKRVPFRVVL
ncbi:hypothetical protein O3G_MSEX003914 [Manduca sexta]|uniref:Uncharacterized protein n=1 Tax=Manduca sexta TaxID=7130 RepID=A0A921YTX0_MANSE|nr:hypothetical protein O3G_MSEX003914 [Manduca sexta]KAG6445467.1 hypothetical protein O3G_MSEX003914 [Manduca sexta]